MNSANKNVLISYIIRTAISFNAMTSNPRANRDRERAAEKVRDSSADLKRSSERVENEGARLISFDLRS